MTDSFTKDMNLARQIQASSAKGEKLYNRIGGRPMLDRVMKVFYDKLYAHPWLGQFFSHVPQKHIEEQQSDFLSLLMGGPRTYGGRMPIDAHMHMMITEEIFALRHELLKESLQEVGLGEQEISDWLDLDLAFKKVLIKDSVEQCKRRFNSDEIVDIAKPSGLPKAS